MTPKIIMPESRVKVGAFGAVMDVYDGVVVDKIEMKFDEGIPLVHQSLLRAIGAVDLLNIALTTAPKIQFSGPLSGLPGQKLRELTK